MTNKNYIVLIVEDDRDDAELIRLELKKSDSIFDFAIVDSIEELTAFLDKATPDIIISDYNLPGFTGLDALKIVRDRIPDIPFILCSGFIGEEQAVDAVRKGVNDYCLKNNLGRLGISVERELKNYESQRENQLEHQLVLATFNASGLSVAIIDKDGKFTKVNNQFTELTGYSDEELVGMSYLDLNEKGKLVEAEYVFNRIISEGGVFTNEWKLIRKDNRDCYVKSTITRIEDERFGNYIISYVQDISERKRLRAIRKHSEVMSNVGGWELDLMLDRIYCNGLVLDLFDLPDGLELAAETLIEKLDTESQEIFKCAIEKTIKDGLAFDKILQSSRDNDAKKLIHVSGVPQQVEGRTVRIYGTFRDVTEEESRNEEIRKLSQVASRMHNGVIIFNDKIEVEWVNDSFLKATGYESKDFIGTGFGEILAGNETDSASIQEGISSFRQELPFRQEFLIYTKEGEKKWFEIDVNPFYDKVKEKQKFIGIQEDITKRKLLEKEREEALANLQKRIKEQTCLYNISSLGGTSIQKLLGKAVSLLAPGWQFPNITAASIEFGDRVYQSKEYRDTDWKLEIERECLNGLLLKISVVYLQDMPVLDEGPFIKEEVALIDSIASHLVLKINHLLNRRELLEKERRLDKMSQISRIGYWELDLDNYVVYWSDMTKQIFDVADDYLPDLETAFCFYKTGEDRKTITRSVENAINHGKSFDVELRINTANGEELWTRSIGEPDMNEDGICNHLSGSFQDIDNQKRTEIASERSRLLLETISDKTEAAIWVRDSEGRHQFVNEKWKKIFELSDKQVIGKTAFELIDEVTAREFQKNDKKVLDTNRPIKYEEKVSTLLGDCHYLTNMFPMGEIPGVGKSTGGIATDITERKQVEEKLKFNSRLLNEIGEAVISTDPDGKIIYWNRAAEQLYGWSTKEALGENIIDITPSIASRELASDIFSKLLAGESWYGEFEVRRKDGSVFLAMVTNSPVIDETGNLIAVIGISSDITEREANEQKIKKSLKEKELLLSEIHHRVKNNLAIISSLLTLQLEDIEDQKFKEILEKSSNRIHSIAMVHELLYQSDNFADIPFEEYIKNLVSTIKDTISFDNKEVGMNTEVNLASLNINQAIPLGLMLNELITNSLKYAFVNSERGEITVHITRSDHNINVVYEDNGKGYPDDIEFTDTANLGHTLILTLLKQLGGDFNVQTKGKFRLEFQFEEHIQGSHSNF